MQRTFLAMTMRLFRGAMKTETTLRNASGDLPTDLHPHALIEEEEEEESTDPNRQRSGEDDSQFSKLVPRFFLSGPPISNNSPLPQSEESSELPGGPTESSLILASTIPIQTSQPQHSGNAMSDQQLSPPSSSTTGSVKSPNSRGSNGHGDEFYLAVLKQPPKFVYSNESFEVALLLEGPKAASPSPSFGDQEIELVASLHHEKTGRECGPEALLITQPSRIVLVPDEDGNLKCDVVCMIRMDSIQRDEGASLAVRFKTRESSPPIGAIMGAATSAIQLVNYKIRITLEDDWGPVWYKDEGGRDKSMEIYAAIYDKDGQLRTGEQIPLHPTLCYESPGNLPIKVSNQDILRTLGTSRVVIDKDTGRARIRFRVEDVSKNHQAQDFVLMVGTDPKAKAFQDVAPDFTPAINVRSKRNKRSRNQAHHSRSSSEISRRTSPTHHVRQRYDDQHEPSGVFDTDDIPRVRDALKSVINWADEVVNGLYPLQWQVLGYAQHPDGSTDYARPYHNMPNPNPCINRVIGLYSDTVRDSLRVLLNYVEHASPHSDDPASIMPLPIAPPPPRPFGEDPMYGMMRSQQPMQMQGHPGMPPQPVPRRAAMPGGPEPYQSNEPPMYQARSSHPMMQHHLQQHQPMPPMHGYMRPPPPPEGDLMPIHLGMPPHRGEMPPNIGVAGDIPMQRSLRPEDESRESEVEFVLAKQYKALRTGERLGFPAYSGNKEILGFYREQVGSGGARQFSPISRHRNDFGPLEIMQATEILEDAIKKKSDAVHSLKDWGSIDNLLNQALVYDWRQDIGND